MNLEVSQPNLETKSLSIAASESRYITVYPFFCASRHIEHAKYDLPVPDGPQIVVTLPLGTPLNKSPDKQAFKI
jgi:hypothetical protein